MTGQGQEQREGSSSTEEAKKRPDSSPQESPKNCSVRADSLSAPGLSERRGLAAQGGVRTELFGNVVQNEADFQRKAPALGAVLDLISFPSGSGGSQ